MSARITEELVRAVQEPAATLVERVVGPFFVTVGAELSVVVNDEVDIDAARSGMFKNTIQFPCVHHVVLPQAMVSTLAGGPFKAKRPGCGPYFTHILAMAAHRVEVAGVDRGSFRPSLGPGELLVHSGVERRAGVMTDGVEELTVVELKVARILFRGTDKARGLRGRGFEPCGPPLC